MAFLGLFKTTSVSTANVHHLAKYVTIGYRRIDVNIYQKSLKKDAKQLVTWALGL